MAVSSTGTTADRIKTRLVGFITGAGMSSVEAPAAAEHDLEAKARARMLIALA